MGRAKARRSASSVDLERGGASLGRGGDPSMPFSLWAQAAMRSKVQLARTSAKGYEGRLPPRPCGRGGGSRLQSGQEPSEDAVVAPIPKSVDGVVAQGVAEAQSSADVEA